MKERPEKLRACALNTTSYKRNSFGLFKLANTTDFRARELRKERKKTEMASPESLEQGPPVTSGSPAGAAPSHDLDRQQVPPVGDTRLNDKEIERGIDAPDSDKGSSDRGAENAVVDEKAGDVPQEQKVGAPPRTKAQNAVIVFALCVCAS